MADMIVHKDKHVFALYKESLSLLIQEKGAGDDLVITDETMLHRMVHILRLRSNDEFIFFDKDMYINATVVAFIGKKQIHLAIQSVHATIILRPQVTFLLPMLKREDYEAALYALTEVGVNTIQLIFTQKTGHKWSGERDEDRAQRIIIAAAEQSKNFAYPQLLAPISLEAALKKYGDYATKLFFDPQGKHFFDVMHTLHTSKPEQVLLLIGPEGDLSLEEKEMVRLHDFIFCALTPTIVRAVQAATLAAGFIRSLLV